MKTKPIQTFVATILVLAASAQAQVTQQWVARYPRTGSGANRASGLAISSSGKAYVTGSTPNGYATVAYDTNGNQLWVAQYPASGGGATAIALDGAGNVYVTGGGPVGSFSFGYTTVSYDANGNQRWAATYQGPGTLSVATAIAVDGSANVYVTGRSNDGTDQSWNFATVSYDMNGNQRWASRYRVANGGAWAMVLDSSGNLYVTGSGSSDGRGSDYVTVAYDTGGNQRWVTRYPDPGSNSADGAYAITVDGAGNVYVTGWNFGDAVTLGYDSNGNQLWENRFQGAAGSGIAADGFGNIIIAGEYSSTDSDYLTVAYGPDGEQLWVSIYDGPLHFGDRATAIAIDATGNSYVTGLSAHSLLGDSYDYATVAYDNSGNQLWAARYEGEGNTVNVANSIAVDSSGNVYVTGFSGDGVIFDFVTIKYSQQ